MALPLHIWLLAAEVITQRAKLGQGMRMCNAVSFTVMHTALLQPDRVNATMHVCVQVVGGFRPSMPRHFPQQLVQLIEECWAQDPADRPSAGQVSTFPTLCTATRFPELAFPPMMACHRGTCRLTILLT